MAWIRACGGGSPAVPDGRTVTPINDVTIWQKCAGIANPTYTTLAEVLADAGILSTLMASNNAVDYLVRCKNWCGTALVPAMTSNTTPSGKCSAQNVYNDNEPYKAFDRDGSNAGWISDTLVNSGQSTERWIEYDFDLPQYIKSFKLFPRSGNSLSSVELFDADTSTTVELFSGSYSAGVEHEFILTNPVSISKCRLYITAVAIGNGRIPQISSIQFYTPNTICSNANAMTYIGQNNYCANTLLADSDWRDAICNSTYFESVLNVKVPTMTSDTTPIGIASASTYSVGSEAYNVFDGNMYAGGWTSSYGGSTNQWLEYQFTENVEIRKVSVVGYTNSYSPQNPKHCQVQAYVNGYWNDVDTEFTCAQTDMPNEKILAPKVSSDKWRLFIKDNWGGTNMNATGLQFYGRVDV